MQTNKQEVINALPYMLAYPAFLAGYQTINEAMNDHLLSNYLSAFMEEDELDLVALGQTNNANEAGSPWFGQVSNPSVSNPLARLCADGAPKLPAYILPALLERLAQNRDIQRMALLVAAYGHYLAERVDDLMDTSTPNGSPLQPGDRAKIDNDDVVAFLEISSMATARLQTYSHFVAMYKSYRTQIAKYGIVFLLRQMAYNRLAIPTA